MCMQQWCAMAGTPMLVGKVDFSSAFDKILHKELLGGLRQQGLSMLMQHMWMKDYMSSEVSLQRPDMEAKLRQ